MAERYTKRIEEYCNAQGISIPSGFYRHPAGRYVAIDVSTEPHRLIAATWHKQADLSYFLASQGQERRFKLLDFQERQELTVAGPATLERGVGF